MERVRSIDAFRGIAIVLMVFFTLMVKLSPESGFFDHNNYSEVHPGDFVLPLFLFASGMSIFFYVKKREEKSGAQFWMDNIERFGKLFGIGMLLSLFSAGWFFGMDEVSLSAILFLLTLMLIRFPDSVLALVCSALALLYLAIYWFGYINIFEHAYLGGYPAVIFYLPVMLAGAVLGRSIYERNLEKMVPKLLLTASLATLILMMIFPIDKMRASPSFMGIAIMLSIILFVLVNRIIDAWGDRLKVFESLGRSPIRYWVLMFALFLIPYNFCYAFGPCTYPMGFSLIQALVISFIFMVLFEKILNFSAGIQKLDGKMKLFKP